MSYPMKEVSNIEPSVILKLPTYIYRKCNEDKKANKGEIVSYNLTTQLSWQSKFCGDYVFFPKLIKINTCITIPDNNIIFKKTCSINYSCVSLDVQSLMKKVWCPVSPEFYKNLYLKSDKYNLISDKRFISGTFIIDKGLLYLE